jgi:hypothetical protein
MIHLVKKVSHSVSPKLFDEIVVAASGGHDGIAFSVGVAAKSTTIEVTD